LVFTPSNASWPNWIEAEFTALRYFTLDGSDYPTHTAQETAIAGYVRWSNKRARPKGRFAVCSKIRRPDTYPVGFQNPGMVPEQRLQAAVAYSLRRPPRTDRRRSTPTRPAVRSSRCTGWRASCTARLSIRAAEQPSAGQPVHISWTEFAPAQFD